MNIRKATINDLEGALTLNQAAIPHVGDIGMSDLEWFLENASRFLVVENKDEIAGFMIVLEPGLNYESLNYKFFCNNYSDFDYVDRIVIDEKYRGKKIGTDLYEELFRKSDKKIITCEVNLNPPNPDSLEFHKALGFKEVAEQLTYKGKKKVAMLVKKI